MHEKAHASCRAFFRTKITRFDCPYSFVNDDKNDPSNEDEEDETMASRSLRSSI